MKRIAIHAHVFYANIWPEIKCCVDNIISVCGASNVLLVVTYPDTMSDVRELFKGFHPLCRFRLSPVPNRGYDIAPFLVEFLGNLDLSHFDYIVKLHTKRDTKKVWCHFRPFLGAEWRRALLSFCSSEEEVSRVLKAFERHPRLGMVASHRVINYSGSDCLLVVRETSRILQKSMKLVPKHFVTVNGTMFIVRANLLEFCQGQYEIGDFTPAGIGERAHKDYGLAGTLEFLFPMGVDAQGYVISEGKWSPTIALFGYKLQTLFFLSLRFCSDLLRKIISEKYDRFLNHFIR